MASLPISDADIRGHTTGGSYERGKAYFEEGAVQSVTRVGKHVLEARVQGSAVHPYLVEIQFDEDTVTEADCTCPYHGGSWCKHVVAALLQVLDAEETARPVTDRLQSLDRNELVQLLERLVERHPDLLDLIERERGRLVEEASE